jgi:hypothetical protein
LKVARTQGNNLYEQLFMGAQSELIRMSDSIRFGCIRPDQIRSSTTAADAHGGNAAPDVVGDSGNDKAKPKDHLQNIASLHQQARTRNDRALLTNPKVLQRYCA